MASDSDDSDDAQATNVDHDGGSPPERGPEAAAVELGAPSPSVAESGDLDTNSATGTLAAVGGGSGTEGIITDATHPVTDSQVTDSQVTDTPVSESPVPDDPLPDSSAPGPDSPASDGSVADSPETDAPAAEGATGLDTASIDAVTGHRDPTTAEPVVGDGAEPSADGQAVAEADDAVPDPADQEPVGFDGRPLPDDGGRPVDDTEGSDHGAPPPTEETAAPRRHTTAVIVLTVLTVLVVGAGVGGLIWSRRNSPKTTPPTTAQTSTPSTLSDGAFVTFHDPETGMTMRYPRGWTRSAAPVREIRLLVSDGKQFSALVRVTRTDVVTTPANLANVKAVTDGIVGPGAQILKQDPITVNDLIGYRYIYTLTDKDSGLTTAHLHYFLFQGHKMNSIVFEALPSETFPRIEGVFGQMLASFHSDPEPP